MNKAYLKYSIKNYLKSFIIILVIGLLFYPLIVTISDFSIRNYHNPSCQVGLAITFLGLLCFIIPVFMNAYLMKKKTIDCYYSLPVTRKQQMNTNLLIGLMLIFIPYIIIYFLGMGIVAIKTSRFQMEYYIPLFFLTIAIGIPLYIFNFFICSRGNTIIDSILFLVLYTFIFTIIMLFFTTIIFHIYLAINSDTIEIYDAINLITFVPLVNVGNYFAMLIQQKSDVYYSLSSKLDYIPIIFIIILGIISYILLNIFTVKDKSERAEQLSSSWFGYKIILPIYFILLTISLTLDNSYDAVISIYALFICFLLVGNIIYYRKFKLPKKAYLVMASYLSISILLFIILNIVISCL